MSIPIRSALAPTFTWTGTASDFRLTYSGSPAVDVTVPSGSYRMCFGPSSGDGADFLRAAQTAINAALAGSGLSDTVALTLGSTGLVTLFSSAPVTIAAGLAMRTLGLTAATASIFAGTRPPWHLALFASIVGGAWTPGVSIGADRIADGRVYAVQSGPNSATLATLARFIPMTPDVRTSYSTGCTALYPAAQYLDAIGSTATDREWSLLDVLNGCRSAVCALARLNYQTLRGSTTERYDRVYVDAPTLTGLDPRQADEAWEAFADLPLSFSRLATSPTETRA